MSEETSADLAGRDSGIAVISVGLPLVTSLDAYAIDQQPDCMPATKLCLPKLMKKPCRQRRRADEWNHLNEQVRAEGLKYQRGYSWNRRNC